MTPRLNGTILFGKLGAFIFHGDRHAEIEALHDEALRRAEMQLRVALAGTTSRKGLVAS